MSLSEAGKLKAIMIIEVLGKPPEHLIETLENIIKQIDEEKGVSITSKKINEPKNIEKSEEFFTTFAEIELEVEEIGILAMLMFKYMPAHIEILEPELIVLSNNNWNDILNELVIKLHRYDEIARVVEMEKRVLERKLRELMSQKTEEKTEKETKEKNPETKKKKKD